MELPDHVDHVGSHAVGRAQPKLPIALVIGHQRNICEPAKGNSR